MDAKDILSGVMPLKKDANGWPIMAPAMAASDRNPYAVRDSKGIPRLPTSARREEFTGHPTGNKPVLTSFAHKPTASPFREALVEDSREGMLNRMVVYHGLGGPRGVHPEGDYVAPDGHRSRSLPEHLMHMLNYEQRGKYRDPRSGESFPDPALLNAHQYAMRHKKARGMSAPVRSVR